MIKFLKVLAFFTSISVIAFATLVFIFVNTEFSGEKITLELSNTIAYAPIIFIPEINNTNYDMLEIEEAEKYEKEPVEIPIYLLEEFLSQWPHIAVYFSNIHNDFSFSFNGDRVYFAASLTKAPFALYIYKRAEVGLTDLSQTHTFLNQYRTGGSGIIQHKHVYGDEFSQHQLLAYNLFLSDNIATRMLRSIHGYQGFNQFVRDLGANPTRGPLQYNNITYSRTTAIDSGIMMRAIYDYIASEQTFSREFLNNLLNNHYPFFISNYPIASKTGWFNDFGRAWHEMAIVYAPSPFILVALSDNFGQSRVIESGDTPAFREISIFFEEFNRTWFPLANQ